MFVLSLIVKDSGEKICLIVIGVLCLVYLVCVTSLNRKHQLAEGGLLHTPQEVPTTTEVPVPEYETVSIYYETGHIEMLSNIVTVDTNEIDIVIVRMEDGNEVQLVPSEFRYIIAQGRKEHDEGTDGIHHIELWYKDVKMYQEELTGAQKDLEKRKIWGVNKGGQNTLIIFGEKISGHILRFD